MEHATNIILWLRIDRKIPYHTVKSENSLLPVPVCALLSTNLTDNKFIQY